MAHALDNDSSGAATPAKAASAATEQDEGTLGRSPSSSSPSRAPLQDLAVKKKKIYELKSMNTEAEKLRSLQEGLPHEFQEGDYAGTILELEKLNIDLNDYLKAVQQYSSELTLRPNSAGTVPAASLQPNFIDASTSRRRRKSWSAVWSRATSRTSRPST